MRGVNEKPLYICSTFTLTAVVALPKAPQGFRQTVQTASKTHSLAPYVQHTQLFTVACISLLFHTN